MADWQKLVRERLSGLQLDAREKEEVQAELASHLEDFYAAVRRKGLSERAAIEQTLEQIEDWGHLQLCLQLARSGGIPMTNRVKQLWLPGLLAFFLSMGGMTLAQEFGPQPLILSLGKGTPVLMFYTVWLCVLPVAGAIAANLAKRAGGAWRVVLLSSIFPVLPFGVVFLVAIPIGLVIDGHLEHTIVAMAFLTMTVGWVLVPGAALLVGGLVVQLISSRSSTSPGVAAR